MKRIVSRRQRGFSIVELMISVAIGLLALVFALRTVGGVERTRSSALGGSDEMQTGMVALFSLSNDAEGAGFGLNDPLVAGCNTHFTDTGHYALAPAQRGSTDITPLAPVVIESHGADPDRITFYAGTALGGTPTWRLLSPFASGGPSLGVDRSGLWIKRKDVLVVVPEQTGGDCLALQAADAPGAATAIPVSSGSDLRLNGGGAGPTFNAYAARVFDLGPIDRLPFRTWSVGGGYLRLQAAADSTDGTAAIVAGNIVSIKAQYGFDERHAPAFQPEAGLQVSRWSSTMIDADGSGITGDAGDWQHIAAVRLAVVARSKFVETPGAGAACTTTTALPIVFADAAPAGVAAVPVTVNVAVAGDPLDWKCYRYRVFETIVTLRNAGWRRASS